MGSRGKNVTPSRVFLGTPRQVQLIPMTGTNADFNRQYRSGEVDSSIEYGLLTDENGNPIVGYKGTAHTTPVDSRVFNNQGGIFTHYHPNNNFGGTLSMADLRVFAQSGLKEVQAVSKQGQLYSIRANANIDRAGLTRWINRNEGLAQRNFERAYDRAIKEATTPLKSGPHKGQVRLSTTRTTTDPNTGKSVTTTSYTYRQPMTRTQAVRYARAYSVGSFDRLYRRALANYGVTYTSTKAGRK